MSGSAGFSKNIFYLVGSSIMGGAGYGKYIFSLESKTGSLVVSLIELMFSGSLVVSLIESM